jgi:hypothetical protein
MHRRHQRSRTPQQNVTLVPLPEKNMNSCYRWYRFTPTGSQRVMMMMMMMMMMML